jgi:aquaporin Z
MIRKFAAEFLGTAILVYFAVGVATLMFGFKFDGASVAAGVVATALAFGLTLLALVYLIGPIIGALILWGTFATSPLYNRTTTGLGIDGYGSKSMIDIDLGGAFIVEAILTAVFVFVVLRVTSEMANAATAAIAIGLALTVVHLVGIPMTGTSVNPARSLGPALVVGGTALSQVWLFIVAPLAGGIIAAGLHQMLYRGQEATLASEAQAPEA